MIFIVLRKERDDPLTWTQLARLDAGYPEQALQRALKESNVTVGGQFATIEEDRLLEATPSVEWDVTMPATATEPGSGHHLRAVEASAELELVG